MRSSSPSFKRLFAAVLLSLPLSAFAGLNDWSKACTSGECYYDLPAQSGKGAGTMKIWGSPDTISDITEAAGWTILGCDSSALKQDIRLVCTSPTGCTHLYAKTGAVNKIVRLPESCAKSAFARVAKEGDAKDQSIPANVAKKFAGQRGTAVPKVKTLSIDTNFAAIDEKVSGKVYFSVIGTTIPSKANSTLTPPTAPRKSSSPSKRGWDDWSVSDETDLPAVDLSHDWPLFSQSISCAGFTAGVNADVSFAGHAELAVGVTASGTYVPPWVDDIALYVGIHTATLDGKLHVQGNIAGSADTGALTLFTVALPGLDWAGLLTVGPTFDIIADASAGLSLDADLTLDLSYNVQNAQLYYPPSGAPASGGTFWPSGSFHATADPTVSANANVNAYITPRVSLDVEALGGVASATVYLDLKATGTATLGLTPSSPTNLSGCANAGLGLSVGAGASADFFGLFDPSTTVSIYDNNWSLFNQCFGSPSRRELIESSSGLHQLERRWSCPSTAPSGQTITIA